MSDINNSMNDMDLDLILGTHEAGEPSALLKARILKAAKTTPMAQTVSKPTFGTRYMTIAASLLIIGTAGLVTLKNTSNTTDDTWQVAASDLGFEDIYEWVEIEDELDDITAY